MSQPIDSGGSAARSSRLRWYQFRLRTLLVVMTLIVGLLVAWRQLAEPYREQRATMKLVSDLGGEYQTAEAAAWQRAIFGADFQNVTMVSLPDCDDLHKYLRPVADLPCLEALAVGGLKFTDQHLGQLRGCKTLRVLVLDSTSVSSEELAAWARDRSEVRTYQSQGRAIRTAMQLGFTVTQTEKVDAKPEVRKFFGDAFLGRAIGLTANESRAIGNDALPHVACLPDLESLDLSRTAIDDAGLVHLHGLKNLRMLHLDATQVSDAGLTHLRDLRNLVRLDLDNTRVSDAGLKELRALPHLATLKLESTRVTEAGLAELRAFPALRVVFLGGNGISAAAEDKLQAALPECFISAKWSSPVRAQGMLRQGQGSGGRDQESGGRYMLSPESSLDVNRGGDDIPKRGDLLFRHDSRLLTPGS